MTDRDLVLSLARGELGNSDPTRYQEAWPEADLTQVHWCGVFCLWCLRKAQLADWTWTMGLGFLYRLKQLKDKSKARPGDVAYFDRLQHHALVEKVDGDKVSTIDGNSTGGKVCSKVRPLESVRAVYSIEELIEPDPMGDTQEVEPLPFGPEMAA